MTAARCAIARHCDGNIGGIGKCLACGIGLIPNEHLQIFAARGRHGNAASDIAEPDHADSGSARRRGQRGPLSLHRQLLILLEWG